MDDLQRILRDVFERCSGIAANRTLCPDCGGTGSDRRRTPWRCPRCAGTGLVDRESGS